MSKLIPVDSVRIPQFLPTRVLLSYEKVSEIRESISRHGLKYPIKVRPGTEPGTYELIDGYVRLKCALQLGWSEIPADINEASDQQVLIDSIITNKHRIEENPITVEKKHDILVNAYGYTHKKLTEELDVSRPWISNALRLLTLPKEIQHCLALNNVSFYHGLLLLQLENPQLQIELAKEVVDKGLSTRQLEERIRELRKPTEEPIGAPEGTFAEFEPEARRAVQPEHKAEVAPSLPEEAAIEEPVEAPSREPKPEPVDFADVTCPVCGAKFRLHHFGPRDHRIQYYVTQSEKS